ncbi:MAG TPA: hypothetical protein VGL72_30420 [Bryobacteraceae bacterium]|jgi:hypothetical protein
MLKKGAAPPHGLEPQLRQVWADLMAEHGPSDPNDRRVVEISTVLPVFGPAFSSHTGIVSFLEPPMDHERAKKSHHSCG